MSGATALTSGRRQLPDFATPAVVFIWLVATVVGLSSTSRIDPDKLTDLGLIAIIPPALWIAYAMLAAGFALSLVRPSASRVLPALYVVSFAFFLHAIPAIAYGTLRYAWAWKHVGVVDYLLRHGALGTNEAALSIYHFWPSFFVAVAGIMRLLHATPFDLIAVARFFPLAIDLGYVFVLTFVFRSFTADWRLIWAANWIFLAANWVGQDYFSPQAVALLLYLGVVALALGPLRIAAAWIGHPRWRLVSRVIRFAAGETPQPAGNRGSAVAVSAVAAFLLILSIVSMHPLTPIVLIFALGALVLSGRLNGSYLLVAVVATVLWTLFAASPFMAVNLPRTLAQVGHEDAVFGGAAVLANVSSGQAIVVAGDRVFSAAIVVLAMVGFARRWRHGHRDGIPALLALSALPMALATSYGGEIGFRVYLFATPFLAFLAAASLFPSLETGRARLLPFWVAALSMAVTIGFILGNNGKDRQYRFQPGEIAAATWLFANAPGPCLLIEGNSNYPSQLLNYENFVYVPLDRESKATRAAILADPAAYLESWFRDDAYESTFLILTHSQFAQEEDLGTAPRGFLSKIETSLLASPRYRVAYAAPGAIIFALNRGGE